MADAHGRTWANALLARSTVIGDQAAVRSKLALTRIRLTTSWEGRANADHFVGTGVKASVCRSMGIEAFGGTPHRHQQAGETQSVGGHFAFLQ